MVQLDIIYSQIGSFLREVANIPKIFESTNLLVEAIRWTTIRDVYKKDLVNHERNSTSSNFKWCNRRISEPSLYIIMEI